MPVDMHEFKFISELEKLDRFAPGGEIDAEVRRIDFPAWRAPFTSLVLWGHSTGYRLPSYAQFFDYCRKAYTHRRHKGKFDRWFEPPRASRVDKRVRFWYESGMSETHLYACLVDAFEDILKEGVVLYDARADWKLKWDVAVLTRGARVRVDAFWGEAEDREEVSARRDIVEHERKRRTSASAHWGNKEPERWELLRISRTEQDLEDVNGVRLFSMKSVNGLLAQIYDQAGFSEDERFLFPPDRAGRRNLYWSMVKSRDD